MLSIRKPAQAAQQQIGTDNKNAAAANPAPRTSADAAPAPSSRSAAGCKSEKKLAAIMIPAALPCMRVRTDGLIFLDKKNE